MFGGAQQRPTSYLWDSGVDANNSDAIWSPFECFVDNRADMKLKHGEPTEVRLKVSTNWAGGRGYYKPNEIAIIAY